MAEVNKNRPGRGVERLSGPDIAHIKLQRRNFRALIQHPPIAKGDDSGSGAGLIKGQQFGGQLRTDPGGITHGKRDNRKASSQDGLLGSCV